MEISESQIVDKAENAKNNQIKLSILPPDSLKSLKIYFVRQAPTKIFETLWNLAKNSRFPRASLKYLSSSRNV